MKTHEHTYYYTGMLSKIEKTFNNFVSFETVFDFRIFSSSFVQLRTRLCDRVDPDPFPAPARA